MVVVGIEEVLDVNKVELVSLAYTLATWIGVDSPWTLRIVHEKASWGCCSMVALISLRTKVITSLLEWNLL